MSGEGAWQTTARRRPPQEHFGQSPGGNAEPVQRTGSPVGRAGAMWPQCGVSQRHPKGARDTASKKGDEGGSRNIGVAEGAQAPQKTGRSNMAGSELGHKAVGDEGPASDRVGQAPCRPAE